MNVNAVSVVAQLVKTGVLKSTWVPILHHPLKKEREVDREKLYLWFKIAFSFKILKDVLARWHEKPSLFIYLFIFTDLLYST